MFEYLSSYKHILVTGPQRSGTHICAKMIAADIGHRYIDETELYIDSLYKLWVLWNMENDIVIQAPALCKYAHLFGDDNSAIVLMRRDPNDIKSSQQRVNWWCEPVELMRYGLLEESVGGEEIARVKYEYWDLKQRSKIRNAYEIQYGSLAEHPMWVPLVQRKGWVAGQTEP